MESSEYDTSEQETSELEADMEHSVTLPVRIPHTGAEGATDEVSSYPMKMLSKVPSYKEQISSNLHHLYQQNLSISLQVKMKRGII